MARPHSSRSRGSKLAAATSAEDRDEDGDTGEDERDTARRNPTRRSSAVASKTNATTKKSTTTAAGRPTTRKSTAPSTSTTTLKPTPTSRTTRSKKAVVDTGLESQTQADGTGRLEKGKGKTRTKVVTGAKMKAPRKKRNSAAVGEKQVRISDQKWQTLKGFGSFIGECEAGCLRGC